MKVTVKHYRYLRSITSKTSFFCSSVLTDIKKNDLNPICKVLLHGIYRNVPVASPWNHWVSHTPAGVTERLED
jgi:hypothetical protein